MKAEILAIGSELLTPRRSDTNSFYLTERLAELGIPVIYRATLRDDRAMLAEGFRQAVARADLVIATGGLGPTADDLTREAIGDALGLSFREDSQIVDAIRRRFEKRGLVMPEVNRKQALVPVGAELLPNTMGTAPGLWIPVPGSTATVALLPGPPGELYRMFENHVLPRLKSREGGPVYRVKLLYIVGLAESFVEQKVGEIYRGVLNPETTILAGAGQVELHLTAEAQTADAAEALNEALAEKMRRALGEHIFSETGESLEAVVGRLLAEKGATLAVAESCTGGLILHRLTEVPGASRYVERGFVTYSNRSKVELLGVPEGLVAAHGAVSAEVAKAMAKGARERASVDFAVAVTGIAGPEGGSPEKPVGLVYVALADSESVSSRRLMLLGGRAQIKWWSSQSALDLIRLRLLKG